jgi:hypothetical protein
MPALPAITGMAMPIPASEPLRARPTSKIMKIPSRMTSSPEVRLVEPPLRREARYKAERKGIVETSRVA